jgi:hypothetical protein
LRPQHRLLRSSPLLVIDLPIGLDQPRADAIRDALAQLPGVAAVTDSGNVPGRDDHRHARQQTVQRVDGSSVAMPVSSSARIFQGLRRAGAGRPHLRRRRKSREASKAW